MSNEKLIIEERSRDIGDFLVGRLLPFRKKRMVGPFIFIDHMGPSQFGPGKYMDIGQHPHIGLSTLTYLFEGEVMHRDSLGTEQRITPGAVNLMVAGSGIVHTERTPLDLRQGQTFNVHGFQIWIALPKEKEEINPAFHHVPASALPKWNTEDFSFSLIAGKGYDHSSPVPFFSPGFLVEVDAKRNATLRIAGELTGEIGICVVNGGITACENEQIGAGNMVVSKTVDVCAVEVEAGSKLLLFGGEPMPEERFIDWNFVSSSKDRIKEARADWKAKNFTFIPGDDSYVPLPSLKV